jgi:hypothetical protein
MLKKINTKAELFYDQKRKSILNKKEHNKIINEDDYKRNISSLSSAIYNLAKLMKYELYKSMKIYNKTQERNE